MKRLEWDVEEDSFTANTPYGMKRFTNVIATKDPEAPRRVVVAAHFDSKFFANYPDSQVRAKLTSQVTSQKKVSSFLVRRILLHHALSCST